MNYDYNIVSHDSLRRKAHSSPIAGSFELKYRDTNRSTTDRSGSAANSSALLVGVVLPSAIAAVCSSLLERKSSSGASLKYPLTSSIYIEDCISAVSGPDTLKQKPSRGVSFQFYIIENCCPMCGPNVSCLVHAENNLSR